MGGSYVIQEGYLLYKYEDEEHHISLGWKHTGRLQERYFVLSMNRKMEIYENSNKEKQVDSANIVGFCAWDGGGLLKVDSYGVELKVERSAHKKMFLAAYNRLDLEKWCKAFLAAIDPESTVAEEIRKERRRIKREEKKKNQEKEEKIRKWKEQQEKLAEKERQKFLDRQEQVNNMTPLERIDDIGSLDDNTIRLLEKRKQRLQRRQAPGGRLNKTAFRKRLEDGAGGKLENVQPLPAKKIEQKIRTNRVELPPPGQFIEFGGSSASPKIKFSSSRDHIREGSESGSDDGSYDNDDYTLAQNKNSFSIAPPSPPPPPPPPPPGAPPFLLSRLERSNSIKSTSFLDESSIEASRASSKKKRGSKRVSTTETSQMNAQGSLAEILGGKRPSAMNSSSRNGRSDSISSSISSSSTSRGHVSSQEADESFKQTPQADLNAMLKARLTEKPPTLRNPPGQAPEPALANAFSASLAAIRKNRLPSECGDTPAEVPVRNRNRDSQLSAEGKDLLHKAISGNFNEKTVKKSVTSSERKGLFDESSSSDEDVGKNGLFGAGSSMVKPNLTSSITSSSVASPTSQSTTKGKTPSTDSEGESDDGATSSYFKSKISPTQRNDIATNLPTPSAPSTLSVSFISYAVQSDGKKSHGVYTFVFTYGSLTHRFSYSYHELEAIHDRLSSELGSESLPKFPSKHWYRNNTKPENMQKRAMEFLSYFQFLISNPRLVKNNRFHFEFKMDNRFVSAISGHVPIGVPTSLPIEPLQITSPPGTDRSPQRVVTTPRPAQNASKSSALFGAAADSESDSDSSDSCGSVKTPEPLKEAPVVKLRQKDRADEASKSSASTRAKERAGQKSRSKDKEPPKTNSCVPVEPPSPLPKAVTGLPPRPNPFGGGRGDLLAAIRQGKQLRKVDEGECQTSASPLPPAGRGASKPSNTSPLPPPPLNQAGSINDAINNAMAARRIHVEYDEHSDEDSDDDWD